VSSEDSDFQQDIENLGQLSDSQKDVINILRVGRQNILVAGWLKSRWL
jgi:hypothetical protein